MKKFKTGDWVKRIPALWAGFNLGFGPLKVKATKNDWMRIGTSSNRWYAMDHFEPDYLTDLKPGDAVVDGAGKTRIVLNVYKRSVDLRDGGTIRTCRLRKGKRKFEVGDFVVRTGGMVAPIGTVARISSRVCDVSTSDVWVLGHRESWGAAYIRHATPEEIKALPIKEGDWYSCEQTGLVYEFHRDWPPLRCCRHATAEEYRKATAPKTRVTNELPPLAGPRSGLAIGEIRSNPFVVDDSAGKVVSPLSWPYSLWVDDVEVTDTWTLARGENVAVRKAKTLPEIKRDLDLSLKIPSTPGKPNPVWEAFASGSAVTRKVPVPRKKRPALTSFIARGVVSPPEETQEKINERIKESMKDEPLEDSHDDDLTLDPLAVEKQFADLQLVNNMLKGTVQVLRERLDKLEADPPKPKVPPLMRNRITGETGFVQISDVPDNEGHCVFTNARWMSGGDEDSELTHEIVNCFPQAMEPVPEIDHSPDTLADLRKQSWWAGHGMGEAHGRRKAKEEYEGSGWFSGLVYGALGSSVGFGIGYLLTTVAF